MLIIRRFIRMAEVVVRTVQMVGAPEGKDEGAIAGL